LHLRTIIALLENNPYVVILVLDFSKAFDRVRHSAVLEKYSRLTIPDNIYNWLVIFQDHSHCTRFGSEVSGLKIITASIVQGSAIGPVSYVVAASDLHPVSGANFMSKADDTYYLVIPADTDNIHSCHSELSNIENWALNNNL